MVRKERSLCVHMARNTSPKLPTNRLIIESTNIGTDKVPTYSLVRAVLRIISACRDPDHSYAWALSVSSPSGTIRFLSIFCAGIARPKTCQLAGSSERQERARHIHAARIKEGLSVTLITPRVTSATNRQSTCGTLEIIRHSTAQLPRPKAVDPLQILYKLLTTP